MVPVGPSQKLQGSKQLNSRERTYLMSSHSSASLGPEWWSVLADDKLNSIVVAPVKISDVPRSDASNERDYRCYKVYFVSDTEVRWLDRCGGDAGRAGEEGCCRGGERGERDSRP